MYQYSNSIVNMKPKKIIVDIFKFKMTEHVRHAQRVVLLITDRENEYLIPFYTVLPTT